ncbi:MAG: amino acid adenylation domain-containing protein, partial [bacterium]|nr:amino acid adenylation domain-containing protein [bacterium]
YENTASKFDMTFGLVESDARCLFYLRYNTALFKKESVRRFARYFEKLLLQVPSNPGEKICEIELLSPGERRRLLYDFNSTSTDYPHEETIHGLFEKQCEKTPHQPAVIYQNNPLTYSALNSEANRLAAVLKEKGAGPGNIVAIILPPGEKIPLSILAVLKAGGGYLPIEPNSPPERLTYILEDSRCRCVLAAGETAAEIVLKNFDATVIDIDGIIGTGKPGSDGRQVPNPINSNCSSHMIYTIYTSGTTGKPKGVVLTHKNLVNYVYWFSRVSELSHRDRALLTSSFAFDLGYTSLFPSLLNGAALYILSKETYLSHRLLLDFIMRNRVSYLKLTPSLFSVIVRSPLFSQQVVQSLRLVLLGGEAINTGDVETAHRSAPHIKIMNHYGPTEATIGCVAQFIDFDTFDSYKKKPTIGSPIHNAAVYILNKYNRLLPAGVPGELCIAGDCLAGGYLNRPQLTAQKFIRHRFEDEKEERLLYRTGDLVKRQPDGNIEFIGRMDHQVKVRGFRIETGEIENRLLSHNTVKETVVVAREREAGDKYLCAYIVPHDSANPGEGELRDFLAQELPDYMVPSYFTVLEKMPLNPHGKINRKALPNPVLTASESKAPPENHTEVKLVRLWSEILALDKGVIGVHDNFFHLGGHSLKAVGLASRIHKEFSVEIPIIQLFKTPTIRGIAGYINSSRSTRHTDIQPVEKKEYYPLSSAQTRLYILQRMKLDGTVYNMPTAIEISGVL